MSTCLNFPHYIAQIPESQPPFFDFFIFSNLDFTIFYVKILISFYTKEVEKMQTQKLFIPAYVLDLELRKSLELGDDEKVMTFQTMLLKHETGASRIAKAHSVYSKAASVTVSP